MLCTHVQLYSVLLFDMYVHTGLHANATSTECFPLVRLLVARSPSSCSRDPSPEEAAPSAHLSVISSH